MSEWDEFSDPVVSESAADWDEFSDPVESVAVAPSLTERQTEFKKANPLGQRIGLGLDAGMESLRASKAMGSAVGAADDLLTFRDRYQKPKPTAPIPTWRKPVNSAISGRPGEPVDPASGLPLVGNSSNPLGTGDLAVGEANRRKSERLDSAVRSYTEHSGKAAAIPMSPVSKAALEAKTFGEAWDVVKEDPIAFIMDTGVRSAPFMVEPIVTGVVGATGGVPGFMLGTGLGSAHVDYAAELGEALQRRGVDVRNPNAVRAALLDRNILSEIRGDARTHAAFVGLFDGLTAGLATKTLAPSALSQPMAREFVNLVNQFGAQSLGGMLGEAGGQWASTGSVHSPGEVIAEGAGELLTAPIDVTTATAAGLRKSAEKKEGGAVEAGVMFGQEQGGDAARGSTGNTQPEPQSDIEAAIRAIGRGGKEAAYSQDPETGAAAVQAIDPNLAVIPTEDGGVLVTTPDRAKAVQQAEAQGQRHQVLGYSAPKPQDSDGNVIQARDERGNIAFQQLVNRDTPEEAAAIKAAAAIGKVERTDVQQALAERASRRRQQAKVDPFSAQVANQNAARQADIDAQMPDRGPRFQVSSQRRIETPQAQVGTRTPVEAKPVPHRYEGGIDFARDAISDPAESSGLELAPKHAVPDNSIDYEYVVEPPPFGLETPRNATRRVARDKRIAEIEDHLGDVALPENFSDPRLKRDEHRDRLQMMTRDLVKGGGIALVPDQKQGYMGSEGRVTTGKKRTPSLNPDWFKNLGESATTDDVKTAVSKALAGDKLGVRQSRIVSAMLEEITGQRIEQVDFVKKELERVRADRRAMADGFAPAASYHQDLIDQAGELFEEDHYNADWTAEARSIEELSEAVQQIDPDRAEAIIERLAKEQISEQQAAHDLWAIIAEENTDGRREEVQGGQVRVRPKDVPRHAGENEGSTQDRGQTEAPDQAGLEVAPERADTTSSGAPQRGDGHEAQPSTPANEGAANLDEGGKRDRAGGADEAGWQSEVRARGENRPDQGVRGRQEPTSVQGTEAGVVDRRNEQRKAPTTAAEVWREAIARQWDNESGKNPEIQALPVDTRRKIAIKHVEIKLAERPLPLDPTSGLPNGKEVIEPSRVTAGQIDGTFLEGVINGLIQHVTNGGTATLGEMDLGNLGGINHFAGQAGGDRAIADISKILTKQAGAQVDILRHGGDEFFGAARDENIADVMAKADGPLQDYMRTTTPRMLNPGLEQAVRESSMSDAEKADVIRFLDTPLAELPAKPKYQNGKATFSPGGTRLHIGAAVEVKADSTAQELYHRADATLTDAKNRNKKTAARQTAPPPTRRNNQPEQQTPPQGGVSASGPFKITPWRNGINVHGDHRAIRARVKAAGIKATGMYRKSHGTVYFGPRFADEVRKVLAADEAPKGADTREFKPTHELPDGTLVRATDEPNVWEDAEGIEYEDNNAVELEAGGTVDKAAHEAATSPKNDLPEPTDAQKEAGNYKKGHIILHGLDIAVENPKGSTRSGTAPDGSRWEIKMAHHYGYIRGTEGKDGDHVDVFLTDKAENPGRPVFVVDQVDPKTKRFDEHKVVMGAATEQEAREAYLANYEKDWDGIGGVTGMSLDEFKEWLANGDTTRRLTSRNEQGRPGGEERADEDNTADDKAYGKQNKIFTEDAAAKARELLRKKLRQINVGLDPEMVQAGIMLAGYHIEAGARSFAAYSKAMIADLGDAVRPYLRAWYEAVRYYPGFDSDGMSPAAEIDTQKESGDAASGRKRVERNSQDTGTGKPVGKEVVRHGSGGTDRSGPGRVRGTDEDPGPGSGDVIPNDAAVASGKEGDLSPFAEAPGAESSASRSDVGERGGDVGLDGPPIEPKTTGAVERKATKPLDLARRRREQRKADEKPVKTADKANIDETLPLLFEGQRKDVLFAEQRFSKPDGYGVLFTNGTGTGKTASGLGIVKRFARQGKTNILIAVPSDKIASDWVGFAKNLRLEVTPLADTKDAGSGIVVTTYANLGQNEAIAKRNWDLVVPDEAHYLMQSKDGAETNALAALRAITMHPRGAYRRTQMLHPHLYRALERVKAQIDEAANKKDAERVKALQDRQDKLWSRLDKAQKKIDAEVAASQGKKRPRVAFLSATPFAYEKTVDYAEGYLFDYEQLSPGASLSYNSGDSFERFMMLHFGYRMRYNKLTEPGSEVDRGLMQRQFNSWLKKEGVLSGRMLDVDADYDRRFILTESAIGQKIDEGLKWLWDNKRMHHVWRAVTKKFDHLSRRYLLEAIKAQEVIPLARAQMDAGRKVVIFHDFKKGGAFNPFNLEGQRYSEEEVVVHGDDGAKDETTTLGDLVREFERERPDLQGLPISGLPSPIDALTKAFPDILIFNGDVPKKERRAVVERFQDDESGDNIILVQSAAGKEGISLHDTTGGFKRVLFNLGLPTQPTTAIQQEGRIYRTGQVSNAMFRYLNTGTNWERFAFADTIARRSSTAENLALGEQARALLDGFIQAYEESDSYPVGHEGEGTGGRARDAAANAALTDWDRAMTMYFAQQKKNSRTKSQEGVDYFATPEPLGLKMVEWADIRLGDEVLEPSAGHGAIARWFPERNSRTVIEPSQELGSRLKMVSDARLLQERFENHHIVNKYDAIVMNPPFGSGGKTAIDHLAKASQHLRDGGRIVALIPRGPAADKRFDKWLYETDEKGKPADKSAADMYLAADITLPTVTFERAGTKVASRVVVLEKATDKETAAHIQQQNRDYSGVDSIKEFFERIEGATLRERAKPDKAVVEDEGVALQENGALYSGYERDTGNIQDRKPGSSAQAEQLAFDLEPPASVSAAKSQAADNFNTHYRRVPVGEIRVGVERVTSPEEAAHVLSGIRKHGEEVFYALVLDKDGNILDVQHHSKGTRDGASVYPEVVVPSIAAVENAGAVWFAHNHPSGVPSPSGADFSITNKLREGLDGSGVELAGHVVLGSGASAYAFRDGSDDQHPVRIKPRLRKRTHAVTERKIRRVPPSERPALTDPTAAANVISQLESPEALILLDNRHRVIGSLAIASDEMKALRKESRARHILAAIDMTNASAGMIKSRDADAARNLARFLNNGNFIRVLDAFIHDESEGRYWSDAERGGSVTQDYGAFFARKRKLANDDVYRTTTPPANPRSVETIEAAIANVLLTWGNNAPAVEVVKSESNLPYHLREQIAALEQNLETAGPVATKGTYDRSTRTVYLVADNIGSKREALTILAHEAVGHYAMEEVLGAEAFGDLVKKIEWMKKAGNRKIRAFAAEVKELYGDLPAAKESSEIIALMAERKELQRLPGRLLSAIRKGYRRFLRALGFKVLFSIADVDSMLARAGRYLRESGGRREQVGGLEHPQFGDIDVAIGKGRTGASRFVGENPELAGSLPDLVADAELIEETPTRATLQNGDTTFELLKKNGRWVLTDARWRRRSPGTDSTTTSPSTEGLDRSGDASFARRPIAQRQRSVIDGVKAGQPLDRLIRLPFEIAGGIDEKGRWKLGVKVEKAAERALTQAKFSDDSMLRFMNPVLESARAGLLDRYGLSEEYKVRAAETDAEERKRLGQMKEILEKLSRAGVNAPEARTLQAVLTGEQIADADWAKLAEPIRRAVDEMGQEAVVLGLISEESYKRNKGTYLHRSYLKHESEFTGVAKLAHNILNKRRRKIVGNSLKGRGMEHKVSVSRLGEVELGDKVRWFDKLSNGKVSRRVFLQKGEGAPAGYEDRGEWEVRAIVGGKAVLWRDFTKRERESMGEILDARYNIAKTFQTLSRDLATARFFNDISKNEEWFRKEEPEGVVLDAGQAGRLTTFAGVDWVRVPDTTISKSQAKKWGAIAGGYVRAEIWRDLNELDQMHTSGAWSKVMTQWKLNKTARSPVVHMNNVMSNLILMDMADVRLQDLIRGIEAYKNRTQDYHDAMDHGAFGGTFVNEEIRRNVLEPLLDEIAKQNRQGEPGVDLKLNILSRLGYALYRGAKWADKKMLDGYQVEDEIFRMATYMRRKALGDTPAEAARTANTQFLNYDIRAPWVNAARRSVLPFISYTYRAVPVVAQSIAHRPWKLAKYATLAYLANVLAYAMAPGDEDEERRTMRREEQGYTWIGTPRMLRMPWRDKYGNPVFLDIRRWIPAGDVFDMNQGQSAIPIPAPLQFGGPLMLGAELALNKQAFTGQEIVNHRTADARDYAEDVGGWAWKSWMPSAAWIPGSWYWDKIGTALEGGRDVLGRPYSVASAAFSSIGIKVKPHDVQVGYATHWREIAKVKQALGSEMWLLESDLNRGLITRGTYIREKRRIEKKLKLLEEDSQELMDAK